MNSTPKLSVTTLATDLDGTLIPVTQTSEQHGAVEHISKLVTKHWLQLISVTGRSLELTLDAIAEFNLPFPQSILCDVGSSIAHRQPDGSYQYDQSYEQMLIDRMGHWTNEAIQVSLSQFIGCVTPQDRCQQTAFKCSFDFPGDSFSLVQTTVARWIADNNCPLDYTLSSDPETGDGLLDILPANVNKGSAIHWWAGHRSIDPSTIVFAGDSGNDTAAMTSGVRAVLVGNADQQLRAETRTAMRDQAMLYLAAGIGPEGVRDGLLFHLGPAALDSLEPQ